MSTQMYVLAKWGRKQELVHGTFDAPQVGEKFKRDKLTGNAEWEIIKVFDHEQQASLQALEQLMGYASLQKLFRI